LAIRRRSKKRHVLYLGDWVFHMGPTFVETPFNVVETKDADLHFYGHRLARALRPKAELTCLSNWELYRLKPGEFEARGGARRLSAASGQQRPVRGLLGVGQRAGGVPDDAAL